MCAVGGWFGDWGDRVCFKVAQIGTLSVFASLGWKLTVACRFWNLIDLSFGHKLVLSVDSGRLMSSVEMRGMG